MEQHKQSYIPEKQTSKTPCNLQPILCITQQRWQASKAWTKLDWTEACVDPTQVSAQSNHSDLAQESIAQKQFEPLGRKQSKQGAT